MTYGPFWTLYSCRWMNKWRIDLFEPSIPAIEQTNGILTCLNPLFLPENEEMTYRPFWTLYSCHRTTKWRIDCFEHSIPAIEQQQNDSPWYNRNGWLGVKHPVTYLQRNDVSTVLNLFFSSHRTKKWRIDRFKHSLPAVEWENDVSTFWKALLLP